MPENSAADACRRKPRLVSEVEANPENLAADARTLGVHLDTHQALALLRFGDLLLRWNRAFNLISRRDTGRLVSRHLLDSLSIAPRLHGRDVMDLGTGAGLPGVPLAIARGDLSFTLVDRSERKIRFIDQVTRTLGLTNVTTQSGDARSLTDSATFDTVVSRAVASLDEIWTLAHQRLRPGGRMLIMHRGQALSERGTVVVGPPGSRVREQVLLEIPGLPQPHELVVLERERSA
jgi:16S rRNA (guanine527-N7)-methyltransferase